MHIQNNEPTKLTWKDTGNFKNLCLSELTNFNENDMIRFIDEIEREILRNSNSFALDYFDKLAEYIKFSMQEVESYVEAKKYSEWLERLYWLRGKNIEIYYGNESRRLVDFLEKCVPALKYDIYNLAVCEMSYRHELLKHSKLSYL